MHKLEREIVKELCNNTIAPSKEVPGTTVIGYCPGHGSVGPMAFLAGGEGTDRIRSDLIRGAEKMGADLFFQIPSAEDVNSSVRDNAISVGEGNGTAGALVSGPHLLSCSHVLCAGESDLVTNSKGDEVGRVSNCSGVVSGCPNPNVNRFDAALATYSKKLEIAEYDHQSIVTPSAGESVSHCGGYSSGRRYGIVVCRGAYARVNNSSKKYIFKDQILVVDASEDDRFASHGDSGSLVVSSDLSPVGLIHAISATKVHMKGSYGYLYVISPIGPILRHFGASLLPYDTDP